MEFEISIKTWNDKWRYEIELEGETVKTGILDTFAECLGKCKEIVEEEQSYYDSEAAAISGESLTPLAPDGGYVCQECGVHSAIVHFENCSLAKPTAGKA
mgnify:CR=1 FL=1